MLCVLGVLRSGLGREVWMPRLVCQPPRWVKWGFPLFALGSIAYLAYWATQVKGPAEFFFDPLAIFACLFAVLAPFSPLFLRVRIEVDSEEREVSHWRGSRLVKRFPVDSIREIQVGPGQKTLRFDDGQALRLNDMWPGSPQIMAFFRELLESKRRSKQAEGDAGARPRRPKKPAVCRVAADGRTVTLPTRHIVFPDRCVACNRPANGTRDVLASRGLDLLVFSIKSEAEIPVPTCSSHRRSRFLATCVFLPLVLGLVVGAVGLFMLVKDKVPEAVGVSVLVVVILGLLHFSRNGLDRVLDRWFLGVEGLHPDTQRGRVTLRFSRPDLCEEVAALTKAVGQQSAAAADEIMEKAGRDPAPE